jgi:23S rRNA (uracil1939-C5)-methyltransferase
LAVDANAPILTVGEELVLSVYALAYGGEGIAKYKGMVVFISEALPGDKVQVRITQVKKRFARGDLMQVLEPSADRIQPFCPLAGNCGGCSWQHFAYHGQLKTKQEFVENALQHIGHLKTIPVLPPLKAVPQTGYRHKIQIPFQAGPVGEGIQAGFYAKQTHQVVVMDECPVQPALGNKLFRAVRELAKSFDYQGYHEELKTGQLRHLVIRVGLHTRELLAVLVTAVEDVPRLHEFASELQRRIPELVGVVQNVNPAVTNVILGPAFKLLAGRPFLYEEIRGLRYRISAESFFQVNPFQLPGLVEAVLQAASLTDRETALDLFCGVGFLTLELARKARMVFGIESVGAAIEDAQANKHLNNFSNVDFSAQDATAGLEKLASRGLMPDVAVLDPPRKGCEPELLKKLASLKPKRLVYVSCNPVTLARDLALLSERGYRINSIQPVDLFPHTYHIESVAGLTRKK